MQQQSFLLKRLKTSRVPSVFIVLSADSNGFCWRILKYHAGMWEEIYNEESGRSSDWWECLQVACRPRVNTWVVGWDMYESLCKLDIYDVLEDEVVSVKTKRRLAKDTTAKSNWQQQAGALVCNSPPTIIDLTFGKQRNVRCIDLANWGLNEEWRSETEYERDIDGATAALQDYVCLVRELDMGTLQATAAGQGYTRFRSNDLKCKVIVHQHEEARKLERRGYIGARNEALRVGPIKEPVYYVDVKAEYASLCLTKRFPTDLLYYCPDGSMFDPLSPGSADFHFCEVEIETDRPRFPVRVGLHTYYPVGRFRTVLCGDELKAAIEDDVVIAFGAHAGYKTDYVWSSYARWYIDSLGKIESLGLAHLKSALKLAFNSSLGKIGASSKLWVDAKSDETKDRWGQWWVEHPGTGEMTQGRAIAGLYQYLDTNNEPSSSIPSIAATMPMYSRMLYWEHRNKAGDGHLFYGDTDGYLVDEIGLQNLELVIPVGGGKPGQLTIRAIADDAWIGGLKHYRLGETWVQAGVPKDAARDSEGRARWSEQEPFAYGLWHGEPFMVRRVERTRYGCRPYEHGTVGPDLRVSPLRADVLDGPDGPETVIYGIYGPIRESEQKKKYSSKAEK